MLLAMAAKLLYEEPQFHFLRLTCFSRALSQAESLNFSPSGVSGLGVVEGSLTIALVVYGGAPEVTVPAVVVFRIVSFWMLLAVGWASWFILRWQAR